MLTPGWGADRLERDGSSPMASKVVQKQGQRYDPNPDCTFF